MVKSNPTGFVLENDSISILGCEDGILEFYQEG